MPTMKNDTPAIAPSPTDLEGPLEFPSLAWFEGLVRAMRENHARYEHLGYADCVAQFTVTDGGKDAKPWSVRLTFDTYDVTGVALATAEREDVTDFALEAPLALWKTVIENTARNHGKPDRELTLNYLSMQVPGLAVTAGDQLRKDFFFRYNQTMQQLMNDSHRLKTRFVT